MLEVAQDIAKHFGLPTDKVVHVKDRAFNDRCAELAAFAVHGTPLSARRACMCCWPIVPSGQPAESCLRNPYMPRPC